MILPIKGLDNLAPKLINQALKEIDKIVEPRIRQVSNSGGQQIQKTAPQITWGAIEDVYKTPFRLLGKLGKQKFSQLKRKIFWKKPNTCYWMQTRESTNTRQLIKGPIRYV